MTPLVCGEMAISALCRWMGKVELSGLEDEDDERWTSNILHEGEGRAMDQVRGDISVSTAELGECGQRVSGWVQTVEPLRFL